jgi:hypothetical protein
MPDRLSMQGRCVTTVLAGGFPYFYFCQLLLLFLFLLLLLLLLLLLYLLAQRGLVWEASVDHFRASTLIFSFIYMFPHEFLTD